MFLVHTRTLEQFRLFCSPIINLQTPLNLRKNTESKNWAELPYFSLTLFFFACFIHLLMLIQLMHFQGVVLASMMLILLEVYQLDQSVFPTAEALISSRSSGQFFTNTYRYAHTTLAYIYHSHSRNGTNSQMSNKSYIRRENRAVGLIAKELVSSKTNGQDISSSCCKSSTCNHLPTVKSPNNYHHCPILYRNQKPVVLTPHHSQQFIRNHSPTPLNAPRINKNLGAKGLLLIAAHQQLQKIHTDISLTLTT